MAKEAKATKSLKGQQTLFSFFQKKPSEEIEKHVSEEKHVSRPHSMSPDASDSEKQPVHSAAHFNINSANSGDVKTPSSRDNVGSISSLPTPITPQNEFSPDDIPSSPLKRVSNSLANED